MAGYIGKGVAGVASVSERKKVFTATAGQTAFTPPGGYTVNNVEVFQNGIRLVDGTDYTATDGATVTLDIGAQVDDEVVIIATGSYSNTDSYTKSEIDTSIDTDALTVQGDPIVARNSTYADGAVVLNRDLDVASVGAAGVALKFGAINNGSDVYPVDITGVTASDGTAGWLAVGMDGSEKMRIDSSGNVDVYQGNDLTWRYAAGSTIRGSMSVDSADNMTFRTGSGNTERVRITNAGIVGVGLTNPTGSFSNGTGTQLGNSFLMANRTSNVCAAFARNTTTGTIMNFAYGSTTTNPATKGTISTNGSSVSYNTTSDHRLKENVVDLTGAITRLNNLDVRRFNFIDDDDDTTVDGFLAHEVATVVPEAVTGEHNEVDDDGNPVYQQIDQSKLVPLLTAALQEAIAKIDALETRVDELEAE